MADLGRNETNVNLTRVECKTRWRTSGCDNNWTTGIRHVTQLILDRKKSLKIPTNYIPGSLYVNNYKHRENERCLYLTSFHKNQTKY